MCLEQREDLRFGDFEAERFHSNFELVVVDLLVFVEVEKLELGSQRRSQLLLSDL